MEQQIIIFPLLIRYINRSLEKSFDKEHLEKNKIEYEYQISK